jgi:molybdate transport system regulatory protein
MAQVRLRIDLAAGTAIGPGKVELLEAVRDSGSLSGAARRLGMSYRRAWLLLDSLNQSFGGPLTTASVGGKGGGGVQVTALGAELIRRFRRLELTVQRLADEQFAGFRARSSGEGRAVKSLPPRRAPRRRAGGKRP